MKITRKNYELFFVDYLDGKLSHSDELELMAFLTANPDLEEELNLVKDIKIEPEKISFFDKNSLKKQEEDGISTERFNELCIGKIENNLSQEEELLLGQYLELNPEKVKELELFAKTILKPDVSVTFENKASLKQTDVLAELFNELCVAKIEKDISSEDEVLLNEYISQNPSLKKDFEMFEKTLLKPDLSVQYPDKSSLKRYGFSYRRIVLRSLSAAAAIAIVFTIYTFVNNSNNKGISPSMFATAIKPIDSANIVENEENTQTEDQTNEQKTDTQIKNKIESVYDAVDTLYNVAQKNKTVIDDTLKQIQKLNNTEIPDQEKLYAANNNNVEHNHQNFDQSYEAIFADTKYTYFRDMTNKVPFEEIQPYSANISFWDVAEESSKGISALTGADLNIKKKSDKKSKTENYSFHIGRFGFSRTVHK